MGQALGPIVYGAALPTLGARISLAGGAAILAATGLAARALLGPPPRHSMKPEDRLIPHRSVVGRILFQRTWRVTTA